MGLIQRIKNEVIYARTGLRTLGRIKEVHENPSTTFCDTIEQLAAEKPENVAILFEDQKLTYRDYNDAANAYAHWARAQGIGAGDRVALLMENRPDYLVAWLGVLKAGAACALVNTNLTAGPLAHSLKISGADHLILGSELAESYASAVDELETPMKVWATGGQVQGAEDLDAALKAADHSNLPEGARAEVSGDSDALYIYTSGTTGLPKAARIPHVRLNTMMIAFSAGANATENDRMYCTLPLYHSAGGICAVGTTLTVGGSVVLRRKFSATQFFDDVHKYDATLFQYIGELCRYLLNTPPGANDKNHRIRLAVGNGLRPEIWEDFQERFNIPRVLEFYGATEGNVALMNFDGTPGAVGRIAPWARKRFNVAIVKFDTEKEEVVRGPDGFCIKADYGEAGEAIGQISNDPDQPTGRFDGYADKAATEKKILRNVFEEGDAWFRTGDLLREDSRGYFYFVDRIGDTFRWKGENVATSEVAEALSVYDGIKEANVYGVQVPGADGRAGMASIVADESVDLDKLAAYLREQLPEYARPHFLRMQPEMEVTGTFKHRKVELVKEGFNPDEIEEPLYFMCPDTKGYIPLDKPLYDRICAGELRF